MICPSPELRNKAKGKGRGRLSALEGRILTWERIIRRQI